VPVSFDNSGDNTINYSNFHLPPLAVLFENAKGTYLPLKYLGKTEQLARAMVKKQTTAYFFIYIRPCQLQLWYVRQLGKQQYHIESCRLPISGQ
jgi:hypothetical protein